jgi:hypothetical protein
MTLLLIQPVSSEIELFHTIKLFVFMVSYGTRINLIIFLDVIVLHARFIVEYSTADDFYFLFLYPGLKPGATNI